jgi:hypothetical protein
MAIALTMKPASASGTDISRLAAELRSSKNR